jgi:hypothetical protein
MNGIYKKIIVIMGTIPAIGKGGKISTNSGDIKIRRADDVFDTVLPLLPTYGVIITKKIIEVTRQSIIKTYKSGTKESELVTLTCEYTFWDTEDGSSITSSSIGCGMDDSDKAYSKAQTVALRIALTEVFAIPFSEPDWRGKDNDESVDDESIEQPSKPVKPRAKPNDVSNDLEAIKVSCRAMRSQVGKDAGDKIAIDCQDGKIPINYDAWSLITWQLYKDKLNNAIDLMLARK